jgi:hypothetical protein
MIVINLYPDWGQQRMGVHVLFQSERLGMAILYVHGKYSLTPWNLLLGAAVLHTHM